MPDAGTRIGRVDRLYALLDGKPMPRAGEKIVYVFIYNDYLTLYVGVTGDFRARMRAHAARPFWKIAKRLVVVRFETMQEAVAYESRTIGYLRPAFNILDKP